MVDSPSFVLKLTEKSSHAAAALRSFPLVTQCVSLGLCLALDANQVLQHKLVFSVVDSEHLLL